MIGFIIKKRLDFDILLIANLISSYFRRSGNNFVIQWFLRSYVGRYFQGGSYKLGTCNFLNLNPIPV